jgi:hypothetical protein
MSNLRNKLKARSESMIQREEFDLHGDTYLAVGLMTGGKNRVQNECFDLTTGQVRDLAKFTQLVIAMCIHDPASGKPVYNVNDQLDRQEIDALAPEDSEALLTPALRVCGWGKEAVKVGKPASEAPDTNSDISSPPALAAA